MSDAPDRLSVTEAALKLGVSIDTVRRRIKSGEMDAQRDNVGKWWVFVPDDGDPPPARPARTPPAPFHASGAVPARSELVERLIFENERLWEVLKDKDQLIRDLALRIAATGAQEDARQERDNARDQLRELKHLVAMMLQKARQDETE
ncbi:MAG: hypothetical protein HQL34_02645 [Alphaproteobacteria bacterium]|nr:hypothetical protein [Alphaproteobacteria bacterium]